MNTDFDNTDVNDVNDVNDLHALRYRLTRESMARQAKMFRQAVAMLFVTMLVVISTIIYIIYYFIAG